MTAPKIKPKPLRRGQKLDAYKLFLLKGKKNSKLAQATGTRLERAVSAK